MTKITLRSYNREVEAITDQGKIDEAIAHCLHILKFFPKHVETYRILGKAYLENRRLGDAADVFQRVLSAVPDDFVSHIGMSIIREDEGNLDAAIWHMQRAYDVQSSNITIQDELRRLYERRDGVEPPKIRLTRAGLARMYARGDMVSEAIAELRAALQEEPDRPDLLALLARMYLTNNQRVKAIQTSSQVLNKLPYCLEANLVISRALQETNRADEAETYLERARELDPYNAYLSEQAPSAELVPDAAVTLLKLEDADIRAMVDEKFSQPDWITSLGEELQEPEQEEEPIDWLLENDEQPVEDSGDRTEAFALDEDLAAGLAASTAFGAAMEEPTSEQETVSDEPREEIDLTDMMDDEEEPPIPDWMQEAGWQVSGGEEPSPEEDAEDAMDAREDDITDSWSMPPDEETAMGEIDDSGLYKADIPAWLQAMAPPEEEATTEPQPAVDDAVESQTGDVPTTEAAEEWTGQADDLDGVETVMETPMDPQDADALPDWLQDEPQDEGETPARDQPDAAPDWLSDAGEETSEGQQPDQEEGEQPLPVWLADLDPASAPVVEGDSEDLSALAAGEASDLADLLASLSEEEEGETAPWMTEDTPADETTQETGEEVPDWLSDLAPDEAEEDAAPAQDLPDWLKAEEEGDEKTVTQEEAGEEDLPDWLKDMAEQAATSSSALAGDPEDKTGVTLWLERNAAQEGDDAGSEEEPAEPTAAAQPEEVPEWLQDLDDASPAEETPGDAPQEVPEEVSETTPEAPQMAGEDFPGMADGEDALRWLESLAAKQGVSEEELLTNPEDRTESPPEWVQSMVEETGPQEPPTPEPVGEELLAQAKEEEQPGEEAGSLDWDALEQEMDAATEVSADTGEEAWLTSMEEDTQEPASEDFLAQAEASVQDAPDWPVPAGEETGTAPESESEELAAWLEDIAEGEETSGEEDAEEMPAWLQETLITSSPLADEAEEDPAATVLEFPAEQEAADDLPEWLAEAETPEPELDAAAEDLPDWMSETMPAETPPAAADETRAGDEEGQDAELPAWLADVEIEEEATLDEAAADASEMPDWMEETGAFEVPAEEPEAEPQAQTPAAGAEEMPAWMADIGEETGEEFQEEPAETAEEEYAWEPEGARSEPAPASTAPPKRRPVDWSSHLEEARQALQRGDLESSVAEYQKLIRRRAHLPDVIQDIQRALEYDHPVNVQLWTTLGDAYAKNHQLQQALDALTRAEELLR